MKYFNREGFLSIFKKYDDVKIFVNNEFLDLKVEGLGDDDIRGQGYNHNAELITFRYEDIEKVNIGNAIITLDMINKSPEETKDASAFPGYDKPEEESKKRSGDKFGYDYTERSVVEIINKDHDLYGVTGILIEIDNEEALIKPLSIERKGIIAVNVDDIKEVQI